MLTSGFAYWFCFSKSKIREEGVLGLALLAGRATFPGLCADTVVRATGVQRPAALCNSLKRGRRLPSKDVSGMWKSGKDRSLVLFYFILPLKYLYVFTFLNR